MENAPNNDAMIGVIPKAKPRRLALKIILPLLGVLFLFLGVEAYAGYGAYREALVGREAALAAADEAKTMNFSAATTHLNDAARHLGKAKARAAVLAPLTVLPVVGRDVKAAQQIISSSYDAVLAFYKIAAVGDSLLKALDSAEGVNAANLTLRGGVEAFFRLPTDERKAVLETLDGLGAKLASSVSLIDSSLQGFEDIPQTRFLESIVSSLAELTDELKSARAEMISAKTVADLLPSISGYPEPKTYLILLENNTELRPTGGFIGLLASVEINAGAIGNIKAEDVYSVDTAGGEKLDTVPPAPLAKYLNVKKWFLRDANWSPDFPTSAKKIVELYGIETGIKDLDGVISIDINLAEDLLKIVGPVTIGTSTFTAANVADEVEFQVEKGFVENGLPVAQRKDVVVGLVYEVFKRAVELPNDGWQKVVDIFLANLAEKHVQVAPFDAAAAAYAREMNYDGALQPYKADTLMLVDANLAAFKTDSVMDRSIDYKIAREGNDLIATATMTYKNNGSFTWKTTRYRDYLRLYVPSGSELISSKGGTENDKILDPRRTPGKVDSYEELGRHVFGAFISVEPGQSGQISFTYRLPASIAAAVNSGLYSLQVIKQAGTDAPPLTLRLDFGKNIKRAMPAEAQADWGDQAYTLATDLRIDRYFEVGF